MPTPPTMATGKAKSNMPIFGSPISLAMPTTSRLVEVPMVVAIPPILAAKPIGISMPVGDDPLRSAMLTSTGNNMMTIGVLFRKPLSTPTTSIVISIENFGCLDHPDEANRTSGCNAPVVSSPLAATIKAQIVIKDSLPNAEKKSAGETTPSLP